MIRLEMEGLLPSWVVPRGLSLNPQENRLAICVSDHKLSYLGFEETRLKGLRGAGEACIWDTGEFEADCYRPDRLNQELSAITFYGKTVAGKFMLQKWTNSFDNWSITK